MNTVSPNNYGALFHDVTGNTLELAVTDRIWELILDTIQENVEIISADASELLIEDIDVNPKFRKNLSNV